MDTLSFVPKEYVRVDLVADTYRLNPIKDTEKRGHGQEDCAKILIKSLKSKISRDFKWFQ